MTQAVIFLLLSVLVLQTSSKPNVDRVKEGKPLSDHEHFDGSEHNAEYDHDAFLGEEAANTFSTLTPEESKNRLGQIVDKIDGDQDGLVTAKELKEWIEHQQKSYIYKDVERLWKSHNLNGDDTLTWDEYNATTYSSLPLEALLKTKANEQMDFANRVRKDKNRWVAADVNKDSDLVFDEFVGFIHPEEREHMFDVFVDEAMEDLDKDHDGKLSLVEYIDELYKPTANEKEPGWVKTERESFMTFRDKNSDGYMERQEIKDWLLPTDYDQSEAEAKHLIYETDKNKDKSLTKEEILENWATFVPSRAMINERDEL